MKRHEPEYISQERRLLAERKKRVTRQLRRVGRLRRNPGDISRAEALLVRFIETQKRRESHFQMVLGVLRRNPRANLSHRLRGGPTRRKQKLRGKAEKYAAWNTRVLGFLDRTYAQRPRYKASLVTLWQKYLELELPNAHFVSEFTSGKKPIVFQRSWEMMLARHLDALGYELSTSDEGPDLYFEHEGQTIWVEAVSPEPKGVPDDWLEHPKPDEFKVGDVPHTECSYGGLPRLRASG
jgi:hypothetical protein